MAVDSKGAWRGSQSRRGSKARGCKWWAMMRSKSTRLKRGALPSVGNHRGKADYKPEIIERHQRQETKEPTTWNVVRGYEGERLRWYGSAEDECLEQRKETG